MKKHESKDLKIGDEIKLEAVRGAPVQIIRPITTKIKGILDYHFFEYIAFRGEFTDVPKEFSIMTTEPADTNSGEKA